MGAADEVALMYAFYRACMSTFSASGAFRVVYFCQIVYYVNGVVRTYLFTLAAGYTSVGASLAYFCSLVVIRAFNNNAGYVGDKMNDTVRTGASAKSTAYTLFRIDASNAVVNSDSTLGADLHTIAVAEAGKGTHTVARIGKICVTAGGNALIIVSLLHYVAGAVAGNVCNLFYNVANLKTHNTCDSLGGIVTTGDTEVSLVALATGECLCVAVASTVTTRATVGTGKAVTDGSLALVNLNAEEMIGNGEKHRTNNCNS